MNEVAWWAGRYRFEGSNAFTGKTLVGQSKFGWILGGQFLLYDTARVDSDLETDSYRAVIGVDPATGKTTGWEFSSTGTVGKYAVSNKGQDIVGKAMSPDAGLLEYKGKLTQNADGYGYAASGDLPGANKTTYSGVWKKLK